MLRFIFILFSLCYINNTFSQDTIKIEPNYFREPLDIPVDLSGTFGELRPNHFHTGLDYKTKGKEGFPVFAVAEGYISRIKSQASGYGYSIYINHPNGYTSVYAHLQRYTNFISDLLYKEQLKAKKFEIDYFPYVNQFMIDKGDIIGYTGNTGGSQGPHLHFEIRETKTELAINPLNFGFSAIDTIRPNIKALFVYPLNDSSNVNNNNIRTAFNVIKTTDSLYNLTDTTKIISVNGSISFGIITEDRQNASNSRNGIYSIELKCDSISVFKTEMNKISFHMQRSINSYFDYEYYQQNKAYIYKSFIDPGNKLELYPFVKDKGVINFTDDKIHNIEYIVKDYSGNTSVMKFKVQSTSTKTKYDRSVPNSIDFYVNKPNVFTNEEVSVNMPIGSLFTDIKFIYSKDSVIKKDAYSYIHNIHNIHNKSVPINKAYSLKIKVDSALINGINHSKLAIVSTAGDYVGGDYVKGFVISNTRSLGSFYVTKDTESPSVKSKYKKYANLSKSSNFNLTIKDNLSGIKEWQGYVDGKWALFSYDKKSNTLTHKFTFKPNNKQHTIKLVIIDKKDNITVWEQVIIR